MYTNFSPGGTKQDIDDVRVTKQYKDVFTLKVKAKKGMRRIL